MKKRLIEWWERIYTSNTVLSIVYWWKNRHHRLHIMKARETIAYIRKNHCSIARFGDGEFELVLRRDRDLGFQGRSEALSDRLRAVLGNRDPNLLVCIPATISSIKGRTKHSRMFWYNWGKQNDLHHRSVELIRQCGNGDYVFGDSQITRCYIAVQNKPMAKLVFEEIRGIWENADLLIVEGEKTRLGVGNDLFANARLIRRVLCPATNAFDCYDRIVEAVEQVWDGQLILLALGPTATVLAADLSRRGMRALDIGHLDIEYEWYRSGAKGHDQIPGKFTNEAAGGDQVAACNDGAYQSQIVARVTAQ